MEYFYINKERKDILKTLIWALTRISWYPSTSQILGGVKDIFRFSQTQTRRVKKSSVRLNATGDPKWVLGFRIKLITGLTLGVSPFCEHKFRRKLKDNVQSFVLVVLKLKLEHAFFCAVNSITKTEQFSEAATRGVLRKKVLLEIL